MIGWDTLSGYNIVKPERTSKKRPPLPIGLDVQNRPRFGAKLARLTRSKG
jgi:hypothetical protein